MSTTTLKSLRAERAAILPKSFAENPIRTSLLSGVQSRNSWLDALFYDVDVITEAETPDLAAWLAREGAVIVVPPTGEGALRVMPSIEAFRAEGGDVGALTVAGVGSSALGAAAFGRNVADAIGAPVAAVVSGYGLADLATEALGGYFWFGGLNSMRHFFEPLDAVSKAFSRQDASADRSLVGQWTRTSKDTETVVQLLMHEDFRDKLLVGHSKGNLVISEALYAIAAEDKALAAEIAAETRIVTISAKIGMPPMFRRVADVVGEWDWFGALNSRPDIPAELTVPRAWHSTNRRFPMGMGIDVAKALTTVLPSLETPRAPQRPALPSLLTDAPQRLPALLRSIPV